MSFQSCIEHGIAVNQGGIENRHTHVVLVQQHAHFRTAKDKALAPLIDQSLRNRFKRRATIFGDNITAKLIIDDAMDFRSIVGFRNDRRQAPRYQSLFKKADIERAFLS